MGPNEVNKVAKITLIFWLMKIVATTLGETLGDFLGDYFGLSYLAGAMITGAVIVVVVLLHYLSNFNHVVLFWIAFIFTRPFGATFGDFLTKPLNKGGMELGTLSSSLIAVSIMILLLIINNKKEKSEAAACKRS